MIAYITGALAQLEPGRAIIELGGLGYQVRISLRTYEQIKDLKEVKLHTHLQIREDAHTLFGFAEPEERRMFELLQSVNGVGGNLAMTILSGISWADLEQTIRLNEKERLKKVRGVGPKTADRILLELRDKLGAIESTQIVSTVRQEAVMALVSLGFPRPMMEQRIDDLLAKQPEGLTLEALIKLALKS